MTVDFYKVRQVEPCTAFTPGGQPYLKEYEIEEGEEPDSLQFSNTNAKRVLVALGLIDDSVSLGELPIFDAAEVAAKCYQFLDFASKRGNDWANEFNAGADPFTQAAVNALCGDGSGGPQIIDMGGGDVKSFLDRIRSLQLFALEAVSMYGKDAGIVGY